MGKTMKARLWGLFAVRKKQESITPDWEIADLVQYRVKLGNGSDGRYCLWFRTRAAARLYKKALQTDNPSAGVLIIRREYSTDGYIIDERNVW